MISQNYPTQMYGLREGQVCLTWANEPSLEDVDALLEYLALYRKVVEKRAAQRQRPVK